MQIKVGYLNLSERSNVKEIVDKVNGLIAGYFLSILLTYRGKYRESVINSYHIDQLKWIAINLTYFHNDLIHLCEQIAFCDDKRCAVMKDENDKPYIYCDVDSHFYSAISSTVYIEKTLESSYELFETKLKKFLEGEEIYVVISMVIPVFKNIFNIFVHFYRIHEIDFKITHLYPVLNQSFKRFALFVTIYNYIVYNDRKPLQEQISNLTTSSIPKIYEQYMDPKVEPKIEQFQIKPQQQQQQQQQRPYYQQQKYYQPQVQYNNQQKRPNNYYNQPIERSNTKPEKYERFANIKSNINISKTDSSKSPQAKTTATSQAQPQIKENNRNPISQQKMKDERIIMNYEDALREESSKIIDTETISIEKQKPSNDNDENAKENDNAVNENDLNQFHNTNGNIAYFYELSFKDDKLFQPCKDLFDGLTLILRKNIKITTFSPSLDVYPLLTFKLIKVENITDDEWNNYHKTISKSFYVLFLKCYEPYSNDFILLPTKDKVILAVRQLSDWLKGGQTVFEKYGADYKEWDEKKKYSVENDLTMHYVSTIFNEYVFHSINGIDWNANPNDQLPVGKTIYEYYRTTYNVEIYDLEQPILLADNSKSKLVPSLCKISHYNEEINTSLDILRKFFRPLADYITEVVNGYNELDNILEIIDSKLSIDNCNNTMIKQLITHRSFVNAYEGIYKPTSDFEQLEKVGDSILECLGCFLCFIHFRQLSGRELSDDHFGQFKTNDVLNEAGRRINLHYILICGQNLDLTVADLFEALLTFLFYNYSIKTTFDLLIHNLFYGDVIGPIWAGIYTDLKTIDRYFPFESPTEKDISYYDSIWKYYQFKNINILKTGLTTQNRSRYEFLGKAVRKFLVINYFYQHHPESSNVQLHCCHEGCFNRLQLVHGTSIHCGFDKYANNGNNNNSSKKFEENIQFGQRVASKIASCYDVILASIFLDNISEILNTTGKGLTSLDVLYKFITSTLLRSSDDPEDLPFYYMRKENEMKNVYNYANGLNSKGERFCPEGCRCMKYPHGSNLTMIPSFAEEHVGKIEIKMDDKKVMKFVKSNNLSQSPVIPTENKGESKVGIIPHKTNTSTPKKEKEEKEEKKYTIQKQTFKVLTLETIDSYTNLEPEDIKIENYDNTNISVEVRNNIIIQGVLYDKLSNIVSEIEKVDDNNNDCKVKIVINKEKHGMWPCVLKTDSENKVDVRTFDEINPITTTYGLGYNQPEKEEEHEIFDGDVKGSTYTFDQTAYEIEIDINIDDKIKSKFLEISCNNRRNLSVVYKEGKEKEILLKGILSNEVDIDDDDDDGLEYNIVDSNDGSRDLSITLPKKEDFLTWKSLFEKVEYGVEYKDREMKLVVVDEELSEIKIVLPTKCDDVKLKRLISSKVGFDKIPKFERFTIYDTPIKGFDLWMCYEHNLFNNDILSRITGRRFLGRAVMFLADGELKRFSGLNIGDLKGICPFIEN